MKKTPYEIKDASLILLSSVLCDKYLILINSCGGTYNSHTGTLLFSGLFQRTSKSIPRSILSTSSIPGDNKPSPPSRTLQ